MRFANFTIDCFVAALTAEYVADGMDRGDAALAALVRVDQLSYRVSIMELLAVDEDGEAVDQAA
jgi:hypothetical protein